VQIFATSSEGGPGVWASLWGRVLVTGMPLLIVLFATLAKAAPPENSIDVGATSHAEAAASPPSDAGGTIATVKMSDDAPMYQPERIVIHSGQTVEWVNAGEVSHSVVDDPTKADKPEDVALPAGAKTFASGNVMPGGKFRYRFLMPGTYRYFCISHEVDAMIGEIVVKPVTPAAAVRAASQLRTHPLADDRTSASR
jgi:plastocyanin